MSLTVNTPVTITFRIKVMTSIPPATISLLFSDPLGESIYDQDGVTAGAVYVPPSDTVEGSYVFTKSFPTPGDWTVVLADGVSGLFTALYSARLQLIKGDSEYDFFIEIGT